MLGIAAPVQAGVVETFNYPDESYLGWGTQTGGDLAGGTGWLEKWQPYGTWAGVVFNQRVQMDGSMEEHVGGQRQFNKAGLGQSLFISGQFTKTGTDDAIWGNWIRLGLEGGGEAIFGLGSNQFTAELDGSKGEADFSGFGAYTPGDTAFLVAKLQFDVDGTANERLTVWVNPTGTESGQTSNMIEFDTGASALSGNLILDSWDLLFTDVSYFDTLKLGATWASVGGPVTPSSVPVPSAACLGLAGLAGLAIWRRAKRSK